jgi:hypothetical protein
MPCGLGSSRPGSRPRRSACAGWGGLGIINWESTRPRS